MSDSPLARRDWHVAAAAQRLMARGVPVPTDALQRQAADDLRLLDNARRAGALKVRKDEKKPPAAPTEVSRVASRMAAEVGGRAYVKPLPVRDRRPRLAPVTGVDALKLAARVARIKAISQKVARVRNGQEIAAGFEYGQLAQDLATVTFNYNAGTGAYAGKSAADRDRIYERQIDDILDRSNAVIRPNWWTK